MSAAGTAPRRSSWPRHIPASRFHGFDYHPESVDQAAAAARTAGVSNTAFEVAAADGFPGTAYDLVCFFDCLHDMGDPVGALQART